VANAQSNAKVVMRAPLDPSQRVSFMAALENLKVAEGPTPARIIFNARTGTIVMGQNVRVRPAVVSHGSLTVNIVENSRVSQPNPLSNGQTVVTPQSNVSVNEERGKAFVWPAGTSLKTIVDAINSLGATPSDLMSILQALKQAGALEGELIVI
ncbi:MAG: flagellar basal body P-ring protein FlgI, partial [Plesiomonas shigelloides]